LSASQYLDRANNGLVINLTALSGGSGFVAAALNDKDQAVGNGFIYNDGTVQALASLLTAGNGWSNLNATGINDNGQIVGQGTYGGQQVAFLMTPDANVTPEPSTIFVWCVIAAACAYRKKRGIAQIDNRKAKSLLGQWSIIAMPLFLSFISKSHVGQISRCGVYRT
jgi:probable HAF family extracellular repeat protein